MWLYLVECSLVSDVDRVERFRLALRFFDDVSTASWFTFSIPTSNFSTTRQNFQFVLSLLFLVLLKVHLNFSLVFYRDYRAVVTSSRHRPFCFHNFVFLLNCLFVLYNAHRISVCVIAVNKSHEFSLKVRRLFFCFSTTTPTPSRQRVIIFSTTTQGIRLRRRVDVFSTTSDTNVHYCVLFSSRVMAKESLRLGLKLGLDLVSSWSVVMHTYLCDCRF